MRSLADRHYLLRSFEVTCTTEHCQYAAVQNVERQLYGFQFHPEVTHSVHGEALLGAFVGLAGMHGTWKMDNFIEEQVKAIQEKCSDGRKVFMLVSGGDRPVRLTRRQLSQGSQLLSVHPVQAASTLLSSSHSCAKRCQERDGSLGSSLTTA